MRNKIKINDIFAYIIGNYRYWCYENYRFLLRKHITEQFEWRMTVMNKECYSSGSCIKCGCDTPALQMANKACDGGCYFEMYNRKKWKDFKVRIAIRKLWEHPLTPNQTYYVAGVDPCKEEGEAVSLITFQTPKGFYTFDYNEWLKINNKNK